MKSMTGFGRAEHKTKAGTFVVEISSVNSRFMEMFVKSTRVISALEPRIREAVSKVVARGKVSVYIGYDEPAESTQKYQINEAACKAYVSQLRKLQKSLKIDGDIAIRDLLLLPDVARPDREEIDLEQAWSHLQRPLKQAVKEFIGMRETEGKALAKDMQGRLDQLLKMTGDVEKKSSNAVKVYAKKLADRIEELMTGQNRDSLRIEEEIAFFADRTDIAEECTRLKSHVEQFRQALKQKEAVGRRMNFLVQEMNREANTIGSKSADFDISTSVISMKEELEKLREQVQNIE